MAGAGGDRLRGATLTLGWLRRLGRLRRLRSLGWLRMLRRLGRLRRPTLQTESQHLWQAPRPRGGGALGDGGQGNKYVCGRGRTFGNS